MGEWTSRGVLRNRRHELYAQGIAAGLDPGDAYVKAGFKELKGVKIYQKAEARTR